MTSSTDQQEPPPPPPSSILDLDRIIGKNVKTVDYQDVGKVVTTLENEDAIMISSEGVHATYNYRVPKNRLQGFDGPDLMLSISRTELADYEINDIKDYAAQLRSIKTEKKEEGGAEEEEEEIIVPVIEEKLNVSKKVITDEATIIKEPVTETKIIEVSVMHEETVIEKRPPTSAAEEGDTTTVLEDPPPRNTRTVIRVPLIHEEVKIKKEPYVKEEIVIRKKPRTETKTVSEFVISEKVDAGKIIPLLKRLEFQKDLAQRAE
ncbi:MAG: YsnF/AvaK domain-containing protein [Thermoproteota archaeon]|nr:YsnF/AvaK domain-containing protein [Thermoproteota archaeon]